MVDSPQRGSDRGENLGDDSVQVRVSRRLHSKALLRQVIDRLVVHLRSEGFSFKLSLEKVIVHQEGAIAVLQGGVGVEHGIIRLHNGGGHLGGGIFSSLPFWAADTNLRGGVDGERQL